jgi:hypothetical protein
MKSDQAMPRRARVVLVAVTGVLRDIVWGALQAERDVTVVAEVHDRASLARALGQTPVDVAICSSEGVLADPVTHLFCEHPKLKVLTIEDDGRRGFLWELRPHRTAIGELTPGLLVSTAREAAMRRGGGT